MIHFFDERKTGAVWALALTALLGACSNVETSGTSEEAEGVIAISDKKIAGVSQKGPFVKGSEVTLRETSKKGDFEPTGREFTTKTISDKGDFKFDGINLESQYVLLSVEGRYEREHTGEASSCPMRLDAVSDLEKRETVNINLLTHFEYKRVLNLVKEGKTFAEAKKQAAKEVLGAFGVKIDVSSAEDLNIYNSTDGDRTLYNISRIIDEQPEWNYWHDWYNADDDVDCSKLQDYIDGFTNDFADDGVLADSIMQDLAGEGYSSAKEWSNMMDVDEDDIKRKDEANPDDISIRFLKSEYDFGILVFLNYMDLELCIADLWGEYRKLDKAMVLDGELVDSGYFLCNGYYWDLTTKEHIDSLKIPIDHKTGSMTDPRDGRKYQTVSFEYEGKKYEWMAEDLKYDSKELYTWTEAMQIDDKYMTEVAEDSLIGEKHQGICPDGWHVSSTEEWDILVNYVGDVKNLLNENWRTSDLDAAFGKDLIGVFYNRFDFNLMPMDTVYLEVYYHSYRQDSYHIEELDEFMKEHYQWELEYAKNDEEREEIEKYLSPRAVGDYYVQVSPYDYRVEEEPLKEGKVRCVKN
ncbi:FISUMP domain-containing protein [Fibrobacter succinogenes]|uniref:FISUMP domain-containing protein n=1 Tax=Fibrobacter succinogenes TaxID=833 RepID=UPI0013D0E865|nr:FISUMP domain-containing protein [Fibrobacter succinogenes]